MAVLQLDTFDDEIISSGGIPAIPFVDEHRQESDQGKRENAGGVRKPCECDAIERP